MALFRTLTAAATISLEASRRLTRNWNISINAFFVLKASGSDIIYDIHNDDYFQIDLYYHF
jgi:hypothetical protein